MMHPAKLFNRIHRNDNYIHIGKQLSYKFHLEHKDKIIYVLFQGSNGFSDWLHNFMAIPSHMEPYEGCGWRVHKGFARVWRSGNDIIMRELTLLTKLFPDYEIIFGGFSHGAPLSMLAAQNWIHLTRERCKCVTFGSPRLAWGDAARRVLQAAMYHTNWVNRADIVTTVPLKSMGFNHIFEHLVNVRRIPFLSNLRVYKHHQIYGNPDIYPDNWESL